MRIEFDTQRRDEVMAALKMVMSLLTEEERKKLMDELGLKPKTEEKKEQGQRRQGGRRSQGQRQQSSQKGSSKLSERQKYYVIGIAASLKDREAISKAIKDEMSSSDASKYIDANKDKAELGKALAYLQNYAFKVWEALGYPKDERERKWLNMRDQIKDDLTKVGAFIVELYNAYMRSKPKEAE